MVEILVSENAGYKIIGKICLELDAYVVAKNKEQFVTWYTSDGKSFYHGHYIRNYDDALLDMFERAARIHGAKVVKLPE